MSVQTKTFSTIVSDAVTAIQSRASTLLDLTIGSILLAVAEAFGFITLWLQGIAVQIAALTRLATSNGADADSFVADFGFARLPAKASSGAVTLARFTATIQATITAAVASGTDANGNTIWTGGSIVQTQDGTVQYQVIPDTTEAAYNGSMNAYVIAAGTYNCLATVQATSTGAVTNAAAGVINTLGQAIPGVDTVTNVLSFTNGADAQSDPALRAAFISYILSLEACTPAAIENAILSVQQNVYESLTENQNYAGATDLGYFYAVVDDGSGDPPSGFISAVSNAIDLVRPIGSTYGVFATTRILANIGMTLTTASGYTHSALVTLAQAALTAYINTLEEGDPLPYGRLYQLAFDASPGITNVTAITLNGATADLTCTNKQVIRAGTLSVV